MLIRKGNIKPIVEGITKRLYSKTNFIGLEITPSSFNTTISEIDISIRPFNASDKNSLNEEFRHARLVEEQIPECYVATTTDNVTIYRQWLFTHDAQSQLLNYFGPIFPNISKNEAIIEGVFTHPDYRGLRIMANAMLKIIQQPHYNNLERIIAFVDAQNTASLKGFERIGFKPYLIRQESWCLFRRKINFLNLQDKTNFEQLLKLS